MYGCHRAAELKGCAVEEMAVDRAFLVSRGVRDAQMQALIAGGYVERRAAPTRAGGDQPGDPARVPRTCFVLTPAGLGLAGSLVQATGNGGSAPAEGAAYSRRSGESVGRPEWVASARELRYGGSVVKRFRRMASIQQRILDAFEELAWPEWIDDPLPRDRYVKTKDRLREAVKSLNRRRIRPLIQFHVDVSESRVYWRVREAR
jgi:hypothetical protein